MRTLHSVLVCVAVLLLLACPGVAQEKEAFSSDQLRAKIEQFEKTDITSKSAAVQSIYQRTLLRLYSQYDAALQLEIADFEAMLAAVGGANADSQKEITLQLQKLTRERSATAEKIQTLTADVRSAAALNPPAVEQKANEQKPTPAFEPTRARTAPAATLVVSQPSAGPAPEPAGNGSASYAVSDVPVITSVQAATTATTVQVKGRVSVINEQIFTNAEDFTPEQLRRAVQKVCRARPPEGRRSDAAGRY